LYFINKFIAIFFFQDFQKALSALTKAHIQSFLRERYGSNALRIYNMLEERGCLSQKQVIIFIEISILNVIVFI